MTETPTQPPDVLLPCPFCGGQPELCWFQAEGKSRTEWVSCKCGAAMHTEANERDQPWNRRTPVLSAEDAWTPLRLAILFHHTYERLAPSVGYDTRTHTRIFDPESPNGKLMVATCEEILHSLLSRKEGT